MGVGGFGGKGGGYQNASSCGGVCANFQLKRRMGRPSASVGKILKGQEFYLGSGDSNASSPICRALLQFSLVFKGGGVAFVLKNRIEHYFNIGPMAGH